ncbi:hypothetical protein [Anaerohalosphaera lusitana]|uniref:hypothetical protein n=1 Tax=Anaerohalosphaera lusitana TaxID=1936003 RepID=UPI003AAF7394
MRAWGWQACWRRPRSIHSSLSLLGRPVISAKKLLTALRVPQHGTAWNWRASFRPARRSNVTRRTFGPEASGS